MAQTTILAEGGTRATSTDTTVAAGSSVTVGLFVSSGVLPAEANAVIYIDTPGLDSRDADLDRLNKQVVVDGPCTFRVERVSGSFGIYTES